MLAVFMRKGFRRLLLMFGAILLISGLASIPAKGKVQADAKEEAESPNPRKDAAAYIGQREILLVEGQVTDASGRTLKDAMITVYRAEAYPDGAPITSTRTDALGDFAVRHTASPSGPLILKVSLAGFADDVQQVEVLPDKPAPFVETVLQGALSLEGRVVDAYSGEPVAGAAVRFQSIGSDRFTTADDAGRFSIESLSPDGGRLLVTAAGHGRTIKHVDSLEDGGEVRVELRPERRVTLTLLNDLDEPVFGAAVEVLDRTHDDFRSVVADEDGRVELNGLNIESKSIELRLWHSEHVSSTVFDRRIKLPENNAHSHHTLVMRRAARLTGRVLDGPKYSNIQGARVMVGTEFDDSNPRTWSDERGRYTLEGIEPGLRTITVHMGDYSPQLKRVLLKPAQTQRIDFALRPPVRVTGIVKSADGESIEGAEVSTMRWLGELTLGLGAVTDAEGRFTISDSPHEEYDVVVNAPGFHLFRKTINPRTGPFEFILQPEPAASRSSSIRLNIGDRAPEVTMTTLRDERLALAELRDKIVVIDFWATWCPPCIEETRHLSRIYDKYRLRKDFELISVSRDFSEGDLRRFLKDHGPVARWHHVYGAERGGEDAVKAFGVSALPRLFIIGRDGKLIDRDLRGEQLIARIDEIMSDSGSNN